MSARLTRFRLRFSRPLAAFAAVVCAALPLAASDWLEWRGPHQNGVSDETGLPDTWEPGGKNQLWAVDLAGRGTPVIRGERVYAFGYRGEGPDLQEVLACFDAATGKTVWEHAYNDYLSDIIYNRYAIASPTVDAETGNVYVTTSAGLLVAVDADGKPLWSHSLMEEMGRMTFPNGRNGSPVIHRNLVIIHCMTANWGAHGPAQDRFYAFNKKSGAPMWVSAPGIRPKDNSFSLPVFAKLGDREVFYSGTGCGNVVCVDANTGDPVWRFPLSVGGVNASVLLYGGDKLIAVHGKENLDSSESGRLIALGRSQTPVPPADGVGSPILEKSAELWRANDAICYTSSPVLVGDRLYLTTETGELAAIDATNGKTLWKEKLGIEQLHASALFADGKLYVPIKDHTFAIVRPTDAKAEVLCKVDVGGECNGAPSAANGRVYLFTTTKLFCFGTVKPGQPDPYVKPASGTGPAAKLMPVPGEVLLKPGEKTTIGLTALNAFGLPVDMPEGVPSWGSFVPPTAKVRALLGATFPDVATMAALPAQKPSAGMFEVTIGTTKGYVRGRVLPSLPLSEKFEVPELPVTHETETGVKFAYPPLPWIGARFKWEVRELDGDKNPDGTTNKVLTKTIDNKLFQRALTFVGTPEMKDYTIEADVMSDGNKRKMSEVGVVNQRYLIILKGNSQELEVNSNLERIRVAVPFAWKPKEWYRLKARVDTAADGSGVVRAKAWKRGEPEPEKWTIEVPHAKAHQSGAPGVFGFSPTDMRVYIDNLSVTSNGKN